MSRTYLAQLYELAATLELRSLSGGVGELAADNAAKTTKPSGGEPKQVVRKHLSLFLSTFAYRIYNITARKHNGYISAACAIFWHIAALRKSHAALPFEPLTSSRLGDFEPLTFRLA
jgi:hypothetical protein